jgi:hypothetical protein
MWVSLQLTLCFPSNLLYWVRWYITPFAYFEELFYLLQSGGQIVDLCYSCLFISSKQKWLKITLMAATHWQIPDALLNHHGLNYHNTCWTKIMLLQLHRMCYNFACTQNMFGNLCAGVVSDHWGRRTRDTESLTTNSHVLKWSSCKQVYS